MGLVASMKRTLLKYPSYLITRELKWHSHQYRGARTAVVSLAPPHEPVGTVLFSYINDPFLLPAGAPIPLSHTRYWESYQMVQTFLDLGYAVDVISFKNDLFVPTKPYAAFVDIYNNMERLGPLLGEQCVKIAHMTTAHWLFHTTAQHRRLQALQRRRGVALQPRIVIRPHWTVERADYATGKLNDYTAATYGFTGKRIWSIPTSGRPMPWIEEKDFNEARRHFVWLGGVGAVHKGLDLVLEAFSAMPDMTLTVCGPFEDEPDFVEAYHRELYQCPNIRAHGWIDIHSSEFLDLARRCGAVIFPSCSEGHCGGIIACMHAGLVPIVSHETGVNVDDETGYLLGECSIDEIKKIVTHVSTLPPHEFEMRARQAWDVTRKNHTRDTFSREYRRIIMTILESARAIGA